MNVKCIKCGKYQHVKWDGCKECGYTPIDSITGNHLLISKVEKKENKND